jgi:fatty acid hydroxylase family protein
VVTLSGRDGAEIRTVGEAWREFRGKHGPQVIAAAIVAAVVGRIALGPLGWMDLAGGVFILVVYPFGEWAIHVHLLHLRPFDFRGRRVELVTAQAHRAHHESPRSLDLINFSPLEALAILALAVPAAAAAAAAGVAAVTQPLGAGPVVTMLLVGYVLVGVYEWTHFLIHTAHRPRSRYYRAIWRNHRLHHFKNEHYWHGITSTAGDRLFRTNPDQADVPRSATARALLGDPGST